MAKVIGPTCPQRHTNGGQTGKASTAPSAYTQLLARGNSRTEQHFSLGATTTTQDFGHKRVPNMRW